MIKLDIKYREDEEISKHADDFLFLQNNNLLAIFR